MALTDTRVRKAKPRERTFKMYDERGLYLEVTPTGSKRWRFRYRRPGTGKESRLSLGVYPETTLKAARKKRDEARALLADGIDPSIARQVEKQAARAAAVGTFEAVARDWHDRHLAGRSEGHQKRTWGIIRRVLLPYIGKRPVSEIKPAEILQALRIVEDSGRLETAHRALQIAGQVFRYAVAHGIAENDPTPGLRGALRPASVRHMPAPTDPEVVASLLRMFDEFQGGPVVSTAIRLLPLLFCRPGELRKMRWDEVDMEAREWRFTATKTGTEHLTPLSTQAVVLLEGIQPLTGHLPGGWVFPGGRTPLRPMSDMAINAAYRRMGIDTRNEITGHGWRAVARTLLHERLGYPAEVIEHQLAHAVPDALGTAYNRTKFIDQRRQMMQAWADYLERLKTGADVVEIGEAKRSGTD